MKDLWKLFALRQQAGGTGGAGTGGDGGGGGAGGGLTAEQAKELEDKHGKEKERLSAENAKWRTDFRKAQDRVTELEAKIAADEEAKKKAAAAGSAATGSGGAPALTAEEVAAMRKEIADLQAFKKASSEEKAVLQREKQEGRRDLLLRKAIEAAEIIGEQEIEFTLGSVIPKVIAHDDGTFTAKYKNAEGEEIEGPIDADFIKAVTPKSLFRAKSGGGSGGRPPAGSGGGKGDDILRDIPQAEWDKMTPEQRKALQRKRMEASGVRVR